MSSVLGSTPSGVVAPSGLTYGSDSVTYEAGVAITSSAPKNSGGVATSYSVNPPLPAGLSINLSTGQISGTPQTAVSSTNYTVTAKNSAGSTSFLLTITVAPAPPNTFTYSSNPALYTKGLLIPNNVPLNAPQAATYSAPSLPAGLSINASTGAISGTPTQILSQTNYSVTASNASGSFTAQINITVNDVAPTSLAYPSSSYIYTKGVAITSIAPTNAGGAVIAYSSSSTLPPGLSLNQTTGVISGTPSMVTPLASYTITASNSGGTTPVTLNLTVNDVAPSPFSYSSPSWNLTVGNSYTNSPSSNGGGAIISYSINPQTLPAGLSFSSTTGVISGTPTQASPSGTAVSYTITATNSGGSPTAVVSILVSPKPPPLPASALYLQPISPPPLTDGSCLQFQVKAVDTNGNEEPVATNVPLLFSAQPANTSSSTFSGNFYSDACNTPVALSTAIAAGTSTLTVYYKQTQAEMVTLGVSSNTANPSNALSGKTITVNILANASTIQVNFPNNLAITDFTCTPVTLGFVDANGNPLSSSSSVAVTLSATNGKFFNVQNCPSTSQTTSFNFSSASSTVYYESQGAAYDTLGVSGSNFSNNVEIAIAPNTALSSVEATLAFTSPNNLTNSLSGTPMGLLTMGSGGQINLVAYNISGKPQAVSNNLLVTLSSGGHSAIYSNSNCTGSPVTTATIPQGQNSVAVYVCDSYSVEQFSVTAQGSGLNSSSLAVISTPLFTVLSITFGSTPTLNQCVSASLQLTDSVLGNPVHPYFNFSLNTEANGTLFQDKNCSVSLPYVNWLAGNNSTTVYFKSPVSFRGYVGFYNFATMNNSPAGSLYISGGVSVSLPPGTADHVSLSGSQLGYANACLGPYNVDVHDLLDNPTLTAKNLTIALSASGVSGAQVFADSNCSVSLSSTTVSAGNYHAVFYTKGSQSGALTLSASTTLGAVASLSVQVSSQSQSNWLAMSTAPSSASMSYANALWSGSQMLFFGNGEGSLYNVSSDSWTAGAFPSLGQMPTRFGLYDGSTFYPGFSGTCPNNSCYLFADNINLVQFRMDKNVTFYISHSDSYYNDLGSGLVPNGPTASGEIAVWYTSNEAPFNSNFSTYLSLLFYNPATLAFRTSSKTPIGIGVIDDISVSSSATDVYFYGGREVLETAAEPAGLLSSLQIYNIATDTWSSVGNSPLTPRAEALSVWTGTQLLVFGGMNLDETGSLNNGAVYNPKTGSWTTMNSNGAPGFQTLNPQIAWTGNSMVVCGFVNSVNSCYAYTPSTDTWQNLSTLSGFPTLSSNFGVGWDGTGLIVWGQSAGSSPSRISSAGALLFLGN